MGAEVSRSPTALDSDGRGKRNQVVLSVLPPEYAPDCVPIYIPPPSPAQFTNFSGTPPAKLPVLCSQLVWQLPGETYLGLLPAVLQWNVNRFIALNAWRSRGVFVPFDSTSENLERLTLSSGADLILWTRSERNGEPDTRLRSLHSDSGITRALAYSAQLLAQGESQDGAYVALRCHGGACVRVCSLQGALLAERECEPKLNPAAVSSFENWLRIGVTFYRLPKLEACATIPAAPSDAIVTSFAVIGAPGRERLVALVLTTKADPEKLLTSTDPQGIERVKVWDLHSGALVCTYPPGPCTGRAIVRIFPRHKLGYCCLPQRASFFSLETGELTLSIELPNQMPVITDESPTRLYYLFAGDSCCYFDSRQNAIGEVKVEGYVRYPRGDFPGIMSHRHRRDSPPSYYLFHCASEKGIAITIPKDADLRAAAYHADAWFIYLRCTLDPQGKTSADAVYLILCGAPVPQVRAVGFLPPGKKNRILFVPPTCNAQPPVLQVDTTLYYIPRPPIAPRAL